MKRIVTWMLLALLALGATCVAAEKTAVSGLRVVCEEQRNTGPGDALNLEWSAVPGATGYEVSRRVLPDGAPKVLGKTAQTWFYDERDPLKPFAYRVRPLFEGTSGEWSEEATLWSGMPDNVPAPKGSVSATGVLLLVNKRAQVVTAYVPDEKGEYTVVLRHMICSTGRVYNRTPNGVFKILSKKHEWYRYPNGTHIRYPSVYRNGLYFHSTLYDARRRIMTSTVSRLGARQSLGCVRLKIEDAKWVYQHLGVGTNVTIVDGAAIPALKKALKPKKVVIRRPAK